MDHSFLRLVGTGTIPLSVIYKPTLIFVCFFALLYSTSYYVGLYSFSNPGSTWARDFALLDITRRGESGKNGKVTRQKGRLASCYYFTRLRFIEERTGKRLGFLFRPCTTVSYTKLKEGSDCVQD